MANLINPLPVITGPRWTGVRYFCTTRAGGVSRPPYDTLNLSARAGDEPHMVEENRSRLRAILPSDPLWLWQVHGSDVVDADGTLPQEPAADASVTTTLGRVLAIMVADCLPILIADDKGKVLGAIHAGWRGLAGGVVERTLQVMQAKAPQSLGWRAWIGPGIGPDAFKVGQDVFDVFAATDPQVQRFFIARREHPGKWFADLPGLARWRLQRAGVEHIASCDFCTVNDARRFFSYRRDGLTGRMAMLAWLSNA
jgi:YfiH family protein